MVTTTVDSSSNHHSPTSAAASPKFPRKNLPSPWAQVVRGPDTEPNRQSPPSSSSSSSSLDSVNSNGAVIDIPTKPAWKRPSNVNAEVGPVMGAVSWPPLSESTKPSAKSTPDSTSPKTPTDDGSLSTPQVPVISDSSQKQASSNVKPNPVMNYNRQRSMKRGGANGNGVGPGPAQNIYSNPSPNLPPPSPPFPVLQIPPSTFANGVPVVPVPSPRDPYRNNWDARPPVGGFTPPMNGQRSPSRRGNVGHHPRGDGTYHNSYGNRRDQDRGGYTNSRDAHVHQQRMPPRGLMRPPPPNPASFMGPQPLRPFANPAGFPEFYYFPTLQFEPFGGMPFFTHAPPPAMFFPVAETPLTNTIANQIDYYFSDVNLVKDEFLRSNMDEQGWVPISLIASFPRVRSLTSNIKLILDSLRTSTVVEVQGDKLRRRNEWMKWLPSTQLRANSDSMSPGESSGNNLAADFEKITVHEETTDKVNSEPTTNGDAAGESSTQSKLPNGDATGSRS
ncbi:la-related protein 1C-like [Abrus precatorius]|uniref:La-related protein 1C-like n=1 Tax=Abrus precatorius TaxID=3816 RepID=A0A8B8LIR0_ABRPR|nr:la-related protein 1C-like [Abrus precatorius]